MGAEDTFPPRMPVLPWAPSSARPPSPGTVAYKQYLALYLALGQSLAMWSRLEGSVELLARMCYHKLDGKTHLDKDNDGMPLLFSPQLTMIAKTAQANPKLKDWTNDIVLACKGARKKNNMRTWLVHGRLTNHESFEKRGVVALMRANMPAPMETTISDIASFFVGVQALSGEFNRITMTVAAENGALER